MSFKNHPWRIKASKSSPKMFLRSKRSCRINLAQEELEINEETELQKESELLEILEGKKAAEINPKIISNKFKKIKS